MSAYTKSVFRTFKNNLRRFFALTAILFLGIAFITGLGGVAPALTTKGNEYYHGAAVADILLKVKDPSSILSGDEKLLNDLKACEDVEDVISFTSRDIERDDGYMRLNYMPLRSLSVSKIALIDGDWPKDDSEVVVEIGNLTLIDRKLGEKIDIKEIGKTVTVCGIVQNPMLFSKEPEPVIAEDGSTDENLKSILYFDSESGASYYESVSHPIFGNISVPIKMTDIYIKLAGSSNYGIFTDKYEKFVAEKKESLLSGPLADKDVVLLTLEENKSYVFYKINIERIGNIAVVIPVFFIAVVALVALTTMTRLVEEDRPAMGCSKTLGYSNFAILFKYLLFAFVCCLIGFISGLIVGSLAMTPAVYQAYAIVFHTLKIEPKLYVGVGLIAFSVIFAAVLCVTSYVVLKDLREEPANLLKHKAPKPGKKVFLEKIPFIWKRISFKYKSTFRNILRQVKHFLMTVISVMGSTALVFAGLALRDVASYESITNAGAGRASDSILLISFVIIFSAALLEMLIIYNLTNINIEERKREIATLKVLGYKEIEVLGYVFREVFIMSLIGTLLGLPVGILFVRFIFAYIEFGKIANIQWYSWIFAVLLSLAFTVIVDLLLSRKIIKVDMNTSLKTVE